jgi:WD40 repeat protein
MVSEKWIPLFIALALVGVLVLSACDSEVTVDAYKDTDGDGLPDLREAALGTDPKDPDSDDDGMPDGWEVDNSLDPITNDASGDPDEDNLINVQEHQRGTDPNNDDSDGDGMPDGWEVDKNLDPTTDDASEDPDEDHRPNVEEYKVGADPHKADSVVLLRTLNGHTDEVYGVVFSPDGELLVSASGDEVRFWQVADGTLLDTLQSSRLILPFASDETVLASRDQSAICVYIWRAVDGLLLSERCRGINDLTVLAISPDNTRLALGLFTGGVEIQRVADGQLLHALSHSGGFVGGLAFSPDGKLLASGGGDTVRLWQVTDGTLLHTLGPTGGRVAFSPDGKVLASSYFNHPVHLWQVADGTLLHTIDRTARHLDFSPDGTLLVGLTANNVVELWEVADGILWWRFLTSATVNSVDFSPDGTLLALGLHDGSVQIWRVWR